MSMFNDRYDDSLSSGGSQYVDWGKAGVTREDWFKPSKHGTVEIDIVPFLMKSDNHPRVRRGKSEIGDADYALDIWVHMGMGPGNVNVVCLKRNYNLACPACEYAEERLKQYGKKDEEYISAKAKRRMLYNVVDVRGDDSVTLVWEVSHFLFEKELIEKSKYEGEKLGKSYLDFADPENGYTVTCRTSTEKFGEFDTTKFKDFSFEQRESGIITAKMVKKAISFDEFLILYNEDQINDILYGTGGTATGEEEDTPRKSSRKSTRTNDEDDDKEETPRRRSRSNDEDEDSTPRRRPRKANDDDDDTSKDEDEPPRRRSRKVDEDDENNAPQRSRRAKKDDDEDEDETPRRSSRNKSESKDDDDEDKDEKPKPRRRSSKDDSDDTSECPFIYKFGADHDAYDDCDDCQLWSECKRAKKNA